MTSTVGPTTHSELNLYSFHFDDDDFLDCFLNHPPLTEMQYPLDYQQFDDKQLQLSYDKNVHRNTLLWTWATMSNSFAKYSQTDHGVFAYL
jgi:hypothetical protein